MAAVTAHPGEHRRNLRDSDLLAYYPIPGDPSLNADWIRDLVESSQDLLCVHNLQGRLLSVNPAPARVLGYTVDEILRISLRDLIPPEFRPEFDEYLQRIAKEGQACGLLAVMTRSGERRIWEYHNTLRTEGVASPVVRGIAHDVTERVLAEKALRESNRKLIEKAREQEAMLRELKLFRTLLDQSNESIEVVDPKTLRLLDVNEKACSELGYSREELLAMTAFDIDPTIAPDSVAQGIEQLRKSGFVLQESVHRRKDGTTFPVEVNMKRVQLGREYVVALTRNITERKRQDERLKEYERVLESLDEMIIVINRDYRYVLANRAFLRSRGMTKDQVLGRPVSELLRPDVFEDTVKGKLDECFSGRIVNYELKYAFPGLGERDIALTYLPIEGPKGIDRAACVLCDITEKKRAAALLEDSEKRFRAVYERAPVGIALVDSRTGRFLQVNAKLCEIAGRTEQEMLHLGYQDVVHPDEVADSSQRLQQLVEEKVGGYHIERRTLRPDGTVAFVNVSLVPMWTAGENARWHMAIVQDITQRRQAEEELRRREAELRETQRVAHMGSWRVDVASGKVSWSDELYQMIGLDPALQVSSFQEMRQHLTPQGWGVLQKAYQQVLDTAQRGHGIEVEFRRPDGTTGWVILRGAVDCGAGAKVIGIHGGAFDITELKRAEEELRRREAELREAQRVAHMGSWRLDLKTEAITWSEQIYRELGLDPELLAPSFDRLNSILTDDGCTRAAQALERIRKTGEIEEIEVGFRRADGSIGCALLRGEPNRDESGAIIGLHGIAFDITERRRAEEALRESEEHLRLAQEVAVIGMYERNFLTGESHWTPQTELIYGLPPGSYPKTVEEFVELVHPDDRPRVRALISKSYESGEVGGEWRVVWPDGTVRWISGRWRTFKDAEGKPVRLIGMDFDITERKRVEEELREAQERLTEEKLYLENSIDTEMGFEEIIGNSKGLKAVMDQVARVAASDATVLLLGETGVGKELVARAIHRLSLRKGNSFIKMNCAAIPSGLLESELFGAEKGAFTGSVSRKIGRLELAHQGTLFLDEIGDISLALQPKLLRVLQDQEFERLGGTETLKVDFRLIAATNRDLAESVRLNEFRRDLYYRLNVFPIRVPPLRQRPGDIPLLVEHFVRKCARRMNKVINSIPKKTMHALVQWPWPGNVRELENFIERSVILTRGSVLAAPLSELQAAAALEDGQKDETLHAAERRHILRALRESHGQISGPEGAASRLGLKRTTLQSKLKQLGIDPRKPLA